MASCIFCVQGFDGTPIFSGASRTNYMLKRHTKWQFHTLSITAAGDTRISSNVCQRPRASRSDSDGLRVLGQQPILRCNICSHAAHAGGRVGGGGHGLHRLLVVTGLVAPTSVQHRLRAGGGSGLSAGHLGARQTGQSAQASREATHSRRSCQDTSQGDSLQTDLCTDSGDVSEFRHRELLFMVCISENDRYVNFGLLITSCKLRLD